jgi:small subunit ribosomal protein S20
LATHKDAEKRARQSEVHRIRNRAWRTRLRNQVKKIRETIAAKDLATAESLLPETVSVLQRAVTKGVLHPRNASRRASRIAKAIQALKKPV